MDPAAVQALIERERERLERCGALGDGAAAWAALAEQHRRAGRLEAAEALAREALAAAPDASASWMALCLALLEQGRIAEARDELARGLAATPSVVLARERIVEWPAAAALAELPDEEEAICVDAVTREEPEPFTLDDAPEALIAFADDDADAFATSAAIEEDASIEADPAASEDEGAADEADSLLLAGRGTFATQTVAALLERQGLADEARRLRERISEDAARAGAFDVVEPAAGEPFTIGRERFAGDEISEAEVRAAHRARVLSTLEQWLGNLRKGVA